MKINKLHRTRPKLLWQFFFFQKQWRKMSEKVELKSTKKNCTGKQIPKE